MDWPQHTYRLREAHQVLQRHSHKEQQQKRNTFRHSEATQQPDSRREGSFRRDIRSLLVGTFTFRYQVRSPPPRSRPNPLCEMRVCARIVLLFML